ncbi:MAG: hypothetical protein AB7P16_25745 [Bradyrhizobium sp.]|uniref:hypothetical protein n=1 Tax=Bradyrhizobium sp. TaxID=376 RepID=UPI003D0E7B5A
MSDRNLRASNSDAGSTEITCERNTPHPHPAALSHDANGKRFLIDQPARSYTIARIAMTWMKQLSIPVFVRRSTLTK